MTAVLPAVTRLSSRVIRVLGCNPGKMTLQGTNTYIIGNGNRRILIDTGDEGKNEFCNNLKSTLIKEDIIIDQIIITHWHHDHIGGLKDLKTLLDNEFTVWKYPIDGELTDGFKSLQNEQDILVEGASLRVIHTPGHTTDHIVLHLKEEEALFSGDCILGEGTTVFEDLYDYMKSLNLILQMNPKVIYPGHGPVVESPSELIQQYINHRNFRESQIKEELYKTQGKIMNEMDLVEIIYKETPRYLYPAAAVNVIHHLQKLEKEGVIVKSDDGWRSNQSN